jgi:hypothetical protein
VRLQRQYRASTEIDELDAGELADSDSGHSITIDIGSDTPISLDRHPEMVGNQGNPIAILDKAGRSALEATLKPVHDSPEPKT